MRKTLAHQPPAITPSGPASDEPPKILCVPYIRGLSEKLERVCTPLGVRAVFKPTRTLRQTLMQLKNCIPEEKKRSVVYEVPCKDCGKTYIGETKRTLNVRLSEYKQAVKRGDPKNGIAVHAHESHHSIDWDGATVEKIVTNYILAEKSYRGHPDQDQWGDHELGWQFAAVHSMEPYPTPTLSTSLFPNSHACVDLTESHSIHPIPTILSY